jgi:hypothetical protein
MRIHHNDLYSSNNGWTGYKNINYNSLVFSRVLQVGARLLITTFFGESLKTTVRSTRLGCFYFPKLEFIYFIWKMAVEIAHARRDPTFRFNFTPRPKPTWYYTYRTTAVCVYTHTRVRAHTALF